MIKVSNTSLRLTPIDDRPTICHALTVIEAMAARRPVVSTSVGGIRELVEHGITEFLAASGDSASLAASLVQLYRRADLPVTRAMHPLKLKEYLATGKPVVVNRLPSTTAWGDCLDVAETPTHFSQLVRDRITSGIPVLQSTARNRLQQERWKSKAEVLEKVLQGNRP